MDKPVVELYWLVWIGSSRVSEGPFFSFDAASAKSCWQTKIVRTALPILPMHEEETE